MALTNKQVRGVCNIFANAFVNTKSEEERKKILLDFEDAFGRGIVNWKTICGDRVKKLTADETIVSSYEKLSTRNDNKNQPDDFTICPLAKEHLEQVMEIINATFDMSLTAYDHPKFNIFIENGYSSVACKDDEVLGVILAHEQPDLSVMSVYINTLAVATRARGTGIGKALFHWLKNAAYEKRAFVIKLQTDPEIEAYEIYKHWGMEESKLVQMKCYCL